MSQVFMDDVSALAGELGGDAQASIEALRDGRIPRFRTEKMMALEECLDATGHIDTRTPLTQQELYLRVIDLLAEEIRAGLITPERVEALVRRIYGPEAP